jgi:hypothetical protein
METTPVFKVVIAYETFAAAARARQVSDRLNAELNLECDVWNMESLVHRPLRELAAASAAQADVIIIATHRGEALPTCVKDWIEEWLPLKMNGTTALVALLVHNDETSREPPAVCAYLGRIAERGGMDFISNAGKLQHAVFRNTEASNPEGTEGEFMEALP